jgi:hypothetical protein
VPYLDLEEAVHHLNCDYLILLNRSSLRTGMRMDYTLYPVNIREPLPCILVPLAGDDPDVLLDLQMAVQQTYVEGPYLRAIDYTISPDPPLDDDNATWADAVLRAAGLRK